ncbi:putative prefoldin subunit 1 [Cladophialophora carrionii]|uniref:Putative prefoldin subunit 1 n=1 Tax=Cladophialophora carrionii TaxID=86049 RepID=A0A1C1C7W6_9EURO|nr:putative prefoldin subunit 1 [Cladophialophora carrionii]
MAIPNAALQKLLQEVEAQAVLSQQKITQTQAELTAKRRDARLNQLTSNELKSLSKDTNVYEGVGKITETSSSRFVAVPMTALNERLATESAALQKDIADLDKKLHYQETTFKNSRQHIEKILQTGAR